MSITNPSSPAPSIKYSFNDPAFYTQVMPAEYIGKRRFELMYGEMRLARFMLVFREHMKYWLAPGPKKSPFKLHEEFSTDAELLSVWSCIDDRRKTAWPTMVPLVEHYIDNIFGRATYDRLVPLWQLETIDWIDREDGRLWQIKIVDRYDRLVAGVNYKDL